MAQCNFELDRYPQHGFILWSVDSVYPLSKKEHNRTDAMELGMAKYLGGVFTTEMSRA